MRSLLREIDLGQWEFSQRRVDLNGEAQEEPDTEEEKKIFSAIRNWIDAVISPIEQDVELIRSAMFDTRYANFFHGPMGVEVVYRGIYGVKGETLKRWLNVGLDEDIPGTGSAERNWVMKPINKQNFVSYTKDVQISYSFSEGDGGGWTGFYNVIFEAGVSNNPNVFLDLHSICKKLNRGTFSIDTNKEKEVAALGPVNVHKIRWRS